MIEVNLARQLQIASTNNWPVTLGYGFMGVLLCCLGVGMASWWWTQSKQQEFEYLLQEKEIHQQSLAKVQARVDHLQQDQAEAQRLRVSLNERRAQAMTKKQPIILVDGVSRSAEGIDIWLDHIQMVGQVVELRGQSFAIKDIGAYIDALEKYRVITALPVLEIFDHEDGERGKVFSFMIRFVLGQGETA
ncbi:MAG: PilN domain-containing protein [Nitrospirota bacterium]|nr:PilN domain-containing protein [Nitrospirota bacterium]